MDKEFYENEQNGNPYSKSGMGAIFKAFDIIAAINKSIDGLTLNEIAEQTQIPLSTVKRIVHGLNARGIIVHLKKGKGYYVNAEVFKYVNSKVNEIHISPVCLFIKSLSEKFQVATSLYCRSGVNGFAADYRGEQGRVQEFAPEGLLLPLGSVAPTFGILAAMPPVEAYKVIEANRERIAFLEMHSAEYVHHLVRVAREQGFLHVQGAWNPSRSHAVFPLILTSGCEAAICAHVERSGDYSKRLQEVTDFVRGFLHKQRFQPSHEG